MTNNQSDKKFFKKEKVIFFQEDENDKIYQVLSGKIKLLRLYGDGGGHSITVRICKEDDFFGNLLGKEEFITATAMTDSWVKTVPKEYYLKKMMSPECADLFPLLANLWKGFADFVLRMDFVLLQKCGNRNLDQAKELKLKKGEEFKKILRQLSAQKNLDLSHEEIGELAGLTRETITRKIDSLRKEGFIINPKNSSRKIILKEKEA